MQRNFSWLLIKLDRVAAWTLLGTMIVYFVSGYGMTKGIINGTLAVNLHNHWLPLVLLGSFCFHACYAISLAFKRWKIWNALTASLLILIFAIFFSGFVYVNNFYQKPDVTTSSEKAMTGIDTKTEETTETTPTVTQKTTTAKNFSAAELARFDGLNGNSAYIAVNGKVYDVSGLFVGGTHRGCTAGEDVSSAFSRIHDKSFLSGFAVVGTFSG